MKKNDILSVVVIMANSIRCVLWRKTNFFLHFSKTRGFFFRKIFSVFMQLPKGYSTYLKF